MADTYKLIETALDSVRGVYEEDTETTVKQLGTMRQANTAVTLKYIKREEEFKKLGRKAENVEASKQELERLKEMLNSVESKLDVVEALAAELDEFTKEL